MRVILRDGSREVTLLTTDQLREFHTHGAALAFLRLFCGQPANMLALRNALAQERGLLGMTQLENHEVLEQIAWQLIRGNVRVLSWPSGREAPSRGRGGARWRGCGA